MRVGMLDEQSPGAIYNVDAKMLESSTIRNKESFIIHRIGRAREARQYRRHHLTHLLITIEDAHPPHRHLLFIRQRPFYDLPMPVPTEQAEKPLNAQPRREA